MNVSKNEGGATTSDSFVSAAIWEECSRSFTLKCGGLLSLYPMQLSQGPTFPDIQLFHSVPLEC